MSDVSYFEVIFRQSPIALMGFGIILVIIGILLFNFILVIGGAVLFIFASIFHRTNKPTSESK